MMTPRWIGLLGWLWHLLFIGVPTYAMFAKNLSWSGIALGAALLLVPAIERVSRFPSTKWCFDRVDNAICSNMKLSPSYEGIANHVELRIKVNQVREKYGFKK